MTHLRRYLEQHGTLQSDQFDAALRRQQIYGGSLDTVLLELELVDASTLNGLLAEACGLPSASPELLETSGPRPWDAIPTDLVEIGWAVPLARTESMIVVAVHPDLPNERLGALYRLSPVVTPVVTPECCVEKIAAERVARVVPQRYAVLFASYIAMLRPRPQARRSLLLDAVPGLGPVDDTQTGPPLPSALPSALPLVAGSDLEVDLDPVQARARRESSRRFRPPGDPVDAYQTLHVTPPPPVPDDSAAALANGRALVLPGDDALPPGYFTRDRDVVDDLETDDDLLAIDASNEDADDDVLAGYAASLGLDLGLDLDAMADLDAATDTRSGDDDGIPIEPAGDDETSPPPPTPIAFAPDGDDELPPGIPSLLPQLHSRPLAVPPVRFEVPALEPTPLAIPPVRFPPRPVVLTTTERLQTRQDEALADERRAAAGRELEQASTRDEVMQALVHGALLTTPRIALFRVRDDALQGLPTPGSALPDLDRTTISLPPGSPMVAVIAQHRYLGENTDPGLLAALEYERPVPCLTCRIDIAERPVLLLYADQGGRVLAAGEIAALEALSRDASAALRRVLEARASAREPDPGPSASSSMLALLEPPPAFGTTEPPGWGPPPPRLEQSLLEEDVRTHQRLPASPLPNRATRIDGSIELPTELERPRRKTMNLSPPPPPLPPPPPMARAVLEPVAIGSSSSRPRFIPPPLDERENSGIISLASPIEEPTARGRIALDDEDWTPLSSGLTNEAELRRIDAALLGFARGEEDLDTIRGFGEAGLARLAAQFPGPLEVLRRDLRALPPPSAHGPPLRAAPQLGHELVPFLLPLFSHADPDVRFYAAFVFQELRDRDCMEPLSRLAFDGSGDVRVVAMRVLETYARSDGFAAAVASVRAELGSSNRTRQLYAARAVGTLRDALALAQLIELLASKDRFIQEAALESLCSITGQQHGLKPHRWKSWHAENGLRHRVEWIIESLRHRDLPVRRWAQDELIRVTGHRIPFSAQGDRNAREVAARAWIDWWTTTGRHRFAAAAPEEHAG